MTQIIAVINALNRRFSDVAIKTSGAS